MLCCINTQTTLDKVALERDVVVLSSDDKQLLNVLCFHITSCLICSSSEMCSNACVTSGTSLGKASEGFAVCIVRQLSA